MSPLSSVDSVALTPTLVWRQENSVIELRSLRPAITNSVSRSLLYDTGWYADDSTFSMRFTKSPFAKSPITKFLNLASFNKSTFFLGFFTMGGVYSSSKDLWVYANTKVPPFGTPHRCSKPGCFFANLSNINSSKIFLIRVENSSRILLNNEL